MNANVCSIFIGKVELNTVVSVVIFAGLPLLMICFAVGAYLANKKRIETLQANAEEMGLSFIDDPGPEFLNRFQGFRLFSRGRRPRAKNLVEGDSGDVKIMIFDYSYMIRSGKSNKHHTQTVVALQAPALSCPQFAISPESFIDRIGGALGFQDINFESHPEFSRMFVLKGQDEDAIREFLRPELLEFFESHAGITLEVDGSVMFFYRPGRIYQPDQLKDLLAQAYQTYGIMIEPAAR